MRKYRVLTWLDEHFEETLLVILLVVVFFVSLIQVIVRNLTFIPSLKWAEEFCRFAWIWSTFLSLPYTIKKGSMLRVTVLRDLLGESAQRWLDLAVNLVTGAAMGVLCVHSVSVIRKIYLSAELSPAMAWPMWAVYSVIFAGFFLGALRAMERIVRTLGELTANRPGRKAGK